MLLINREMDHSPIQSERFQFFVYITGYAQAQGVKSAQIKLNKVYLQFFV